jgi:hypothetical protein
MCDRDPCPSRVFQVTFWIPHLTPATGFSVKQQAAFLKGFCGALQCRRGIRTPPRFKGLEEERDSRSKPLVCRFLHRRHDSPALLPRPGAEFPGASGTAIIYKLRCRTVSSFFWRRSQVGKWACEKRHKRVCYGLDDVRGEGMHQGSPRNMDLPLMNIKEGPSSSQSCSVSSSGMGSLSAYHCWKGLSWAVENRPCPVKDITARSGPGLWEFRSRSDKCKKPVGEPPIPALARCVIAAL